MKIASWQNKKKKKIIVKQASKLRKKREWKCEISTNAKYQILFINLYIFHVLIHIFHIFFSPCAPAILF